jgi:mono/diheme cytochrome c family protein
VKRPTRKLLLTFAAALAAVAVLGGCDAQENADLANGRELFTVNCGQCHTLAEAGTNGTIGPDLDAAFAGARDAGMDNDTIEGVVQTQIEVPRKTDETDPTYMPPDLVEGDDAEDVAAYVASVAGVPGIQAPTAPGGPGGQVFAANNCGSCHTLAAAGTTGTTGPNLDEVLPSQDVAQITEDIVDPSADIAQGFSDGVMPQDYENTIDPADLKVLVQFLSDCAGSKQKGCGEEAGGGKG